MGQFETLFYRFGLLHATTTINQNEKTIKLILCILFLAGAVLVLGCATNSSVNESHKAYLDTLISQWGPEEKWTPEQKHQALLGIIELRNQMASQATETSKR